MSIKKNIVAIVSPMAIVCHVNVSEGSMPLIAKLSENWYHPVVDIYIAKPKSLSLSSRHEQLNHAIRIALQDMGERVNALRYLRNGGGVYAKRSANDHYLTRYALFGEDDDTEF